MQTGFVQSLAATLSQHWALVLAFLAAAWLIKNRYNRGLNKYPGPFVASFTDWWRFLDVYGQRPERTLRALHDKHGDVVRTGPNTLSFANPAALKTIYGLNKGFVKVDFLIFYPHIQRATLTCKQSDFYIVQQSVVNGFRLASLFSTTNNDFHAQFRRSVNSAFAMSALVQYEPFVDNTTKLFLDQTEKLFAGDPSGCDFTRWLQFYAFDVIGEITYSKRHGFLERNEDVEGIVAYLSKLFLYVAPVSRPPTQTPKFPTCLTNPGRPNPLPRPLIPQEPHLPEALPMGPRRLDLPRRPLRPRPHGRAPHPRTALLLGRGPAHQLGQEASPGPRPPVQVHRRARGPSGIHDGLARHDHGRVHGLCRVRDDGHFAVVGVLLYHAGPAVLRDAEERNRRRGQSGRLFGLGNGPRDVCGSAKAALPARVHPGSLPHAPRRRPAPRTYRAPAGRRDCGSFRPRWHKRRMFGVADPPPARALWARRGRVPTGAVAGGSDAGRRGRSQEDQEDERHDVPVWHGEQDVHWQEYQPVGDLQGGAEPDEAV